jgi:hypothetical protein
MNKYTILKNEKEVEDFYSTAEPIETFNDWLDSSGFDREYEIIERMENGNHTAKVGDDVYELIKKY